MTTTYQQETRTPSGAIVAPTPALSRDPRYQAFWLLRLGYTAIPLTMGIDKYFNGLVYWPKYLVGAGVTRRRPRRRGVRRGRRPGCQ